MIHDRCVTCLSYTCKLNNTLCLPIRQIREKLAIVATSTHNIKNTRLLRKQEHECPYSHLYTLINPISPPPNQHATIFPFPSVVYGDESRLEDDSPRAHRHCGQRRCCLSQWAGALPGLTGYTYSTYKFLQTTACYSTSFSMSDSVSSCFHEIFLLNTGRWEL